MQSQSMNAIECLIVASNDQAMRNDKTDQLRASIPKHQPKESAKKLELKINSEDNTHDRRIENTEDPATRIHKRER